MIGGDRGKRPEERGQGVYHGGGKARDSRFNRVDQGKAIKVHGVANKKELYLGQKRNRRREKRERGGEGMLLVVPQ